MEYKLSTAHKLAIKIRHFLTGLSISNEQETEQYLHDITLVIDTISAKRIEENTEHKEKDSE